MLFIRSRNLFLFLISLCACGSPSTKPDTRVSSPDNGEQVGGLAHFAAPPQKSPSALSQESPQSAATWRDRLNGQLYPLPDSIGNKPVSFYLKSPRVSSLAKALYTAHFRPTDNDSTAQLLSLVTTTDEEIRPFYRWCLDFTIIISDGALGEYPGVPALAYATMFPQEFFTYMDKDKTGERYESWVTIIAYGGLNDYTKPGAEIQGVIAEKMTKNCQACTVKTSQRIAEFAKDIAVAAHAS